VTLLIYLLLGTLAFGQAFTFQDQAYMGQVMGGGAGSPAWVPTDYSGLIGWYKFDALTNADNTAVTYAPDSSGLGRDLSQSVAARQPVYSNNLQNALGGIYIDSATTDCLTNIAAAQLEFTNMTLYAVMYRIRIGGKRSCVIMPSAYNNDYDGAYAGIIGSDVSGDAYGMRDYRGANLSYLSPIITNKAALFISAYDTLTNQIWMGSSVGSKVACTQPFRCNRLVVGAGMVSSAPSLGMSGNWYELLIYTNVHNASQRAVVGSYLSNRWAL